MSTGTTSFIRMAVALIVVTAVASVSLGFIYAWTKGPIEQVQLEKQQKAIEAVTGAYTNDPVAEQFEVTVGGEQLTVFPAQISANERAYAIKTSSSKGYNGKIELMAGVNAGGAIIDIQVLRHSETPGLGSKIRDQKFRQQYVGKSLTGFDFRVKKDGGAIDAISGATISTRAFSEAVEKALQAFEQIEK